MKNLDYQEEIKRRKDTIIKTEKEIFDTHLNLIKETYDNANQSDRNVILSGLESLLYRVANLKEIADSLVINEENNSFDPETATKVREKLGFKQIDLANILGIAYSNISKYESGQIEVRLKRKTNKPVMRYIGWLKEKGYNPFNI